MQDAISPDAISPMDGEPGGGTSGDRASGGGARAHTVVDSPIGPLTLVAADDLLTGVFMRVPGHDPEPAALGPREPGRPVLAEAARQLAEYFAGTRTGFDLPLRLEGTEFQRRVWAGLREIPYGKTWSYGQLARHIGSPGGSRAVGLANNRNPISIIVPCHRVIGSSGDLTGYGGGLDRKRFLLDLERRATEPTLPGFD